MVKVAKVVGLNSDTRAAQLLVVPERSDFDLYIIVVCQAEDAFTKARFALSSAEELFYSSSDPISTRLSQTIQKIEEVLAEADQKQILMVSVQHGESDQKALYMMFNSELEQEKGIAGLLFREDRIADLCELGTSMQLISGFLTTGDRLMMTTQGLLEILGDELKDLLKMPVEVLEDEIVGRLPQAQVLPTATVVLENRSEVIPEVVDQSPSSMPTLSKFKLPIKLNLQPLTTGILKIIPRSRRGLAVLGVILLLIVAGGMILTYFQQKNAGLDREFNGYFQASVENFEKAKALKDLDPQSSAQSLEQADSSLILALKLKPNEAKALALQKEIGDQRGGILKVIESPELSPWLDLGLIKKGFSTTHLSLSLGKLLVLDTAQNSLVVITLDNKSQKIIAGSEEFGQGRMAALNGDLAFVRSDDKGVVKIDAQSEDSVLVAKPDSEWGRIADLYGFSNNIYLLDADKDQIYKYVPIEKGFSGKFNYLRSDTVVDLADSLRMQIDSSIWVLLRNGSIYKFTQGIKDDFSLSGLDTSLASAKTIFVSDETENLYILENNRLVVTDKKGVYRAQYRSDRFSQILDLVVDEKSKRVYLLDGSQIYLMELQ